MNDNRNADERHYSDKDDSDCYRDLHLELFSTQNAQPHDFERSENIMQPDVRLSPVPRRHGAHFGLREEQR